MILVFGSINIDLVARVPRLPRPGETALAESYATCFGGKGANQAVAAARARDAGGPEVHMVGAIGQDGFGEASRHNLRDRGVGTRGLQNTGRPTGCAFISVGDSGENAITVASGANLDLRAAALADDGLEGLRMLVLQLEVPIAENLAMARRARQVGARVLLNLAPAPTAAQMAWLPDLLGLVDLLVANEHEALATAALLGLPATDPQAAMQALCGRAGVAGVVTLGAAGAMAWPPAGPPLLATALPVDPVDTTGAGDTFVGILALSLVMGQSLPLALKRASTGASLACRVAGAQPGMPDAAQLRAAMNRPE